MMPSRVAPRPVSVLALLCVVALAHASPADDKVKLGLHSTAGETYRRKSEVTIKLEANGEKVTLEQKENVLVTVKEVKADGTIVTNHKVESETRTVNGEKVPHEDGGELDEYTATESPDGHLLAYEPKKKEEDDKTHLNERMFQAGSVIFSPNAVGKGDKWSVEFEPNNKLGTGKAKGNYVLEAFEDVGGIKCARVKIDYRELDGKVKVEYLGSSWVEVASGDEVKADFKINNIEFGSDEAQLLGIGTGTSQRISGSPLKGAQGAKPNDPNVAPKKEEEDNIDKKMKDFEKVPGLFTFYKRTKDNRQQVYMEIKEDQLDKLFMLQATASTGSADGRVVSGDPISDTVFSFKRMPADKIYLTIPNYSVASPQNKETQRSLDRSFPEQYVDSYHIEAKQVDRKSVLLDMSSFFVGDFAQLSAALGGGGGSPFLGMMGGSSQPDRERSFISELKSFPTNVYAQTTFVFPGRKTGAYYEAPSYTGDGRGTVIKLDYNLFALPVDNGYKPRAYDSRVGYFTTDHMDFSKDDEEEKRQQLILRWNLKKKDPSATLSVPVEPIVFWLDNAIPTEWRSAVSDSITQWNVAFEKIGYKDAIVVKQMPDKADFDHADMRYNVVRWVSSPGDAYAVALFRHNPITGQILNASITVDSNMVRFVSGEQDLYKGALSRWAKVAKVELFAPAASEDKKQETPVARRTNLAFCDYAKEAAYNRDFGWLAADLAKPYDVEPGFRTTYVKQFLHEVVGHEMGHILGLRHNFVASTELSYAELGDPLLIKQKGNSSSLMDYLPFNPHGLESKEIPFYSQTIGTYDKWAIEYGYRDVPSISPADEVRQLKILASQTNEPGKRYMSDEFADGVDPFVVRFDFGKDPLSFFESEADLSQKLLMKVGDRYPKSGETFFTFTRAFGRLFNAHVGAVVNATGFLGGVRKNPNFKGDSNEQPPIVPVDATTQRRALNEVTKYIFDRHSFDLPKKYYTMLASNPKNTFSMVNGQDFDYLGTMELIQRLGVAFTLSPDVLSRLLDQEFKAEGTEVLTAGEVINTVDKAVWSELTTHEEPTLLRRSLQRSHVDTLVQLALDASLSGEIRQMARTDLKSLVVRLKVADGRPPIKAHYDDLATRIQKVLDARPIIRP